MEPLLENKGFAGIVNCSDFVSSLNVLIRTDVLCILILKQFFTIPTYNNGKITVNLIVSEHKVFYI